MADVSSISASGSSSMQPSSMQPNSTKINYSTSKIAKEGWLFKRGEHIKNWRPRYFFLYYDGSLIGFKSKPSDQNSMDDPLNNFSVKGCQIMPTDKPKPYTFLIRCWQVLAVIERTFHVETEKERDEWVAAIKYVSEHATDAIEKYQAIPPFLNHQFNEDVDMKPAEQATVEDLSAKFSVQGTCSSKSTGKRKVVSIGHFCLIC